MWMINASISSMISKDSYKVELGIYLIKKWFIETFSLTKRSKRICDSLFGDFLCAANESLSTLSAYTNSIATKDLKALKKFLPKVRKFVSRLEQIEYFGDPLLGEKIQFTLDKLYELEAELKIIVYTHKEKKPSQSAFIKQLSEKSKNAISFALRSNGR